jgi:hypothetical protein
MGDRMVRDRMVHGRHRMVDEIACSIDHMLHAISCTIRHASIRHLDPTHPTTSVTSVPCMVVAFVSNQSRASRGEQRRVSFLVSGTEA